MLLDYSKFAGGLPEQWIYAGSIAFGVDACMAIEVHVTANAEEISIEGLRRPTIVRHAILLMRQALGVKDGFRIISRSPEALSHVGLGSTPILITAIAAAVNEIYGKPLSPFELLDFVVRNHAEEVDGDEDYVLRIQAMGAAAAVGLAGGGMVVLAGAATVIARMPLPQTHQFVIGVPKGLNRRDSFRSITDDAATYPYLSAISERARFNVAYDVLHELLPAMTQGDLRAISHVIRKHRLNSEQLDRFEMRYPGRSRVVAHLLSYADTRLDTIVSISSTGPAVFAFTDDPSAVVSYFRMADYEPVIAPPNNTGIVYSRSQRIR